jgi:Ca-activated chloride channel homolog
MRAFLCCCVLLTATTAVLGDGLLMATDADYPGEFMRHRLTDVEVDIDGVVARTSVTHEFINEWDQTTGAVYSFPLPPAARATRFLYWHRDVVYQAIIEEQEQSTTPGTGEGGTGAQVNRYLGPNPLRLALTKVDPGLQRVRLEYVELCEHHAGVSSYEYPLATGDFVTRPLEHMLFRVNVTAPTPITDAGGLTSLSALRWEETGDQSLTVQGELSKAYPVGDAEFWYRSETDELSIDLYSRAGGSATAPGHFALFMRPPTHAAADAVMPRRVFFVVSNSSWIAANTLRQIAQTVSAGLAQLRPQDEFNLVIVSKDVRPWRDAPMPASPENISAAVEYLAGISPSLGTRLDRALETCLSQVHDDRKANAIIAVLGERSPLDPRAIQALNTLRTGIFPIALGSDIDRARLEMLAGLNQGFVTYVDEHDDVDTVLERALSSLSRPVLSNTVVEFGGADAHQVWPSVLPVTYAGSYLVAYGRNGNAGPSALTLTGLSPSGVLSYSTGVDFSRSGGPRFTESLWAGSQLDEIERAIAVYGYDDELRQQAVDLSLRYGVRCKYTAFVADYETEYSEEEPEGIAWIDPFSVELDDPTAVLRVADAAAGTPPDSTGHASTGDEPAAAAASAIVGSFPNPFNATALLRVFLADDSRGHAVLLKVYNVLGQLVAVLDLTDLSPGWHQVPFSGLDHFGRQLATGMYIVRLQLDSRPVSSWRIQLVR